MSKPRYSEFVDNIDIDAYEQAIGFEPIETRGDNDIGQCPDPWCLHKHGDSTGKFAIHREKRVYNCWVCGGGSLLSLTMEINGMDIDEATEWLRQFTHGDLRSDSEFLEHYRALIADTQKRVAMMPYFNERVLERFASDTSWFLQRGIKEEIINEYRLCYADVTLKPAPVKQHGGKREKIGEDYYGPTAVFPHFWKGKLVGWQHRWIDHPDVPKWLAKYTNTTDFPKADTLFNFDKALASGRPVVVCESVPTVLLLAGYEVPAVSFFGSDLKDPQLRLLRRIQAGVLLAPDNDTTGDKMLRHATSYLQDYIEVKHIPKVKIVPGSDLGDLAYDKHRAPDESIWEALYSYLDRAETPSLL